MDDGACISPEGIRLSPAEDELSAEERRMVTSIRMGGYDSAGVGYGYLWAATRVLSVPFSLSELQIPETRVGCSGKRPARSRKAFESRNATPGEIHVLRHRRVRLYRDLAWAAAGVFDLWADPSGSRKERRRQRQTETSTDADVIRAFPEAESALRRRAALKPKELRRARKEESDNLLLNLRFLIRHHTVLRGASCWARISDLVQALDAGSSDQETLRRRYNRISPAMKERERARRDRQ